MLITASPLHGVYLVDVEPSADERGLFARTFDAQSFGSAGLMTGIAQCSTSYSPTPYTLRGLHFQTGRHAESKLIRCTRGRVFDVAVDVRPESPSYLAWTSTELSADNRRAVFIPAGFAHGVLTLEPDSELLYLIDAPYDSDAATGLRWDDPDIGIAWPGQPTVVSARDAAFPLVRS